MTINHFSLDQLRACARGYDASLITPVVEHCRSCEKCGDTLAIFLALNRLEEQRSRSTAIRSRTAAGVAAGIVIALAIGFGAYQLGDPSPLPVPVRDDLTALATTEPLPSVMIRFQLGSAIQASSADTQQRLQAAGEALAASQHTRAADELQQLHADHPNSLVIAGYLGIALYLSGDDSRRVGQLLSTGAVDDDLPVALSCKWYLANHLLRTGDEAAARILLTELAAFPDFRGRLSADLLLRLDQLERN